ncbi:MAG: DUF368 domain-containing protein [Lachnospirales bacterium]
MKGILVGVANIIPGVSGGTLAVVLNIFDELIFSINNLFKDFKKSCTFLIPIGLGAVFGIIAFSSLINFGLTNYPFITNMLFAGLVAGSIPLIYGNTKKGESKKYNFLLFLLSFAIICVLTIIELQDPTTTGMTSKGLVIRLFFGGLIASSAMIIPGISGSFLLILMGLYPIIINALASIGDYLVEIKNISLLLNIIFTIAPLGVGIIIGIFLVSKLIEIAFNKAYSSTYFIILGLIFGSLVSIFINPSTYGSDFGFLNLIGGVITFVSGVGISLVLGKSK